MMFLVWDGCDDVTNLQPPHAMILKKMISTTPYHDSEEDGRNQKRIKTRRRECLNLYLGTGWYNLTKTRANTKKPHIRASKARGHTKVKHGVIIINRTG